MADTGAPHFIPYVEPTDLVRDYPAADEAQAEAVADALDAAGGLVAVSYAELKTTTTASLATNTTLDILTLSHALSDASNKLMVFALANVTDGQAGVSQMTAAIEFTADGTLIGAGNVAGNRTRASTHNRSSDVASEKISHNSPSFQHLPATTNSVEYKMRVRNTGTFTRAMFVNRSSGDTNNLQFARTLCTLTLMEVKV